MMQKLLTTSIAAALGVLLALGVARAQPADGEGADRQADDDRGANEGRPQPPAPPPPAPQPPPPPPPPPPDSRGKDVAKPLRRASSSRSRSSSRRRGPTRYSRARGVGIYHKAHLMAGVFQTEIASMVDGGGVTRENKTSFLFELDMSYLGVSSMYGNFHGIEMFTGIVSAPFDMYWGFGMPITFLNVGHGGPGTLRLGGSFGVGLAYHHAFAYLRGRAAAVIIPDKLDVEASYRWIPDSADATYSGSGSFEDTNLRISAFYHTGGKKGRAWELFVQVWERQRRLDGEPIPDAPAAVKTTVFGLGMTFL